MGSCCSEEPKHKHFILINSQNYYTNVNNNNNSSTNGRNKKQLQSTEKELSKTSFSVDTNSQTAQVNDNSFNSVGDLLINGDVQESKQENNSINKDIMKKYKFVFENNLKVPKCKRRAKSKNTRKLS
jgi:hypothetical protein